jgi:hypothetical protein
MRLGQFWKVGKCGLWLPPVHELELGEGDPNQVDVSIAQA